jgi:intein/homing endonuclease
MSKECKVEECSRPAKTKGFCGWCYRKYERGLYESDGSLSLEEAVKKTARDARKARRESTKLLREFKEKKEKIKKRLSHGTLRVLQERHEETRSTFHCPEFNICMSEAVCYGRIFISGKYRECNKCRVHENRMDFLKKFLDDQEATDERQN